MDINDVLKPWIMENEKRSRLAEDLLYTWNTMDASDTATIADKYAYIENIVLSFTEDYYSKSGAAEQNFLPKEILLTMWEHFGLDPYAQH
jgi:hypothetical protein